MISTLERAIILLEHPPWSVLYRVVIGYLTLALCAHLCPGGNPLWVHILGFLGVLFSLRLVPAVLRKMLPFSSEAIAVWTGRRMMAKRFDSYQWRKLLWIGTGMAVYAVFSGQLSGAGAVLAIFCITSGGIGEWFWRRRVADGGALFEGK